MYITNMTTSEKLQLKQQTFYLFIHGTLAGLPTQPSPPAGVSKAQVPLKAIRDKLFCPDQNQGWDMSGTVKPSIGNMKKPIYRCRTWRTKPWNRTCNDALLSSAYSANGMNICKVIAWLLNIKKQNQLSTISGSKWKYRTIRTIRIMIQGATAILYHVSISATYQSAAKLIQGTRAALDPTCHRISSDPRRAPECFNWETSWESANETIWNNTVDGLEIRRAQVKRFAA